MRLAGGPTSSEGRVEVLRHGVWAGLCASTFDGAAATVICRQLSFRCVAGDQVCSSQNVVAHGGAGNKMLGAAGRLTNRFSDMPRPWQADNVIIVLVCARQHVL